MPIPDNYRYSKEHTWIEKVSEKEGIIGITEFAQGELGEIVFVDLPALGKSFHKDDVFGSVEALKTTSDLFMPVSGEVIAVNEKLVTETTLLNTDPFTEGWLIKVKFFDLQEFESALTAADYAKISA